MPDDVSANHVVEGLRFAIMLYAKLRRKRGEMLHITEVKLIEAVDDFQAMPTE